MGLRVFDLCKRFGDRGVLDHLELSISLGEAVAVIGPSGSGKSTLLNILGSLLLPDSGSVSLGNIQVENLRGRALAEYRSKQVGFVFQEHLLLPHLAALENVLLPSLGRRERAPVELAKELLEWVGLGDRISDFPAMLSVGQRQRVALARALVHEPNLILADEPTGSLDHARADEIVDLLLYERKGGRMIVMVTHNLDLVAKFDKVYRLDSGKLIAEAP